MGKLPKIVGTQKSEFDKLLKQEKSGISSSGFARLIPDKTGDEMALTSIILSAFRLVKEFRQQILFSDIKLKRGEMFCYTEVAFSAFKETIKGKEQNSRIDGLVIVVNRGGKIIDAAFFEMKSGGNTIEEEQIKQYMHIARLCNVEKMITVSNEFVQEPVQTPLNIKIPKDIKLYHLSWTYIRTVASILLFKNDEKGKEKKRIDDDDQIEIMKEVVTYLDSSNSGVCGFSIMRDGWKKVIDAIQKDTPLVKSNPNFQETIVSWLQEEKDMALILSRETGVLVQLNKKRATREYHTETLVKHKQLTSFLSVKNTVSDIMITVDLNGEKVKMSIKTNVRPSKTLRGRLGGVKTQISNALNSLEKADSNKSKSLSKFLRENLHITIDIKNFRSSPLGKAFDDFDEIYELNELKGKEIRGFYISLTKKISFGRKKFIEEIEKMLVEFYGGIVQNIKNWEQEAPKVRVDQ